MNYMAFHTTWAKIICVIIVAYLLFGFHFYIQDRKSRLRVRICDGGAELHQIGDYNEIAAQHCHLQTLNLAEELPTIFFLTTGWLPLVLARTGYGAILYDWYESIVPPEAQPIEPAQQ